MKKYDNKKSNNKVSQIKQRMFRSIGGGVGLWSTITETLLIPGLFTTFGIALKNRIDSHNNNQKTDEEEE